MFAWAPIPERNIAHLGSVEFSKLLLSSARRLPWHPGWASVSMAMAMFASAWWKTPQRLTTSHPQHPQLPRRRQQSSSLYPYPGADPVKPKRSWAHIKQKFFASFFQKRSACPRLSSSQSVGPGKMVGCPSAPHPCEDGSMSRASFRWGWLAWAQSVDRCASAAAGKR